MQNGMGTGFFLDCTKNKILAFIATAAHVVEKSYESDHPIKIIHYESGNEATLMKGYFGVISNTERDSAMIFFSSKLLPFPEVPLPMINPKKIKKVGVEVAWVGFPSVTYPDPTLCFFKGSVSAFHFEQDYYLIDGVAINGVSGGPVFVDNNNTPEVVGIITAYRSNLSKGRLLPGLAQAQDVSSFHEWISNIRSWEEAKKEEAKIKESLKPRF